LLERMEKQLQFVVRYIRM